MLGLNIIKEAAREPAKQILRNQLLVPEPILEKKLGLNIGYNSRTNKFENLFDAGVMDPFISVKNSLLNGAGVASLLLTTETVVVNEDLNQKVRVHDELNI